MVHVWAIGLKSTMKFTCIHKQCSFVCTDGLFSWYKKGVQSPTFCSTGNVKMETISYCSLLPVPPPCLAPNPGPHTYLGLEKHLLYEREVKNIASNEAWRALTVVHLQQQEQPLLGLSRCSSRVPHRSSEWEIPKVFLMCVKVWKPLA